ncbi:MAG: SDR family oxidoreductase [Salibacteraceae bacterium]
MKSKTVLITGATAGIGEACAQEFAQNGHRLILTGRRVDRLAQLSTDLQEKFQVDVLALEFDVRDREMTSKVLGNLPAAYQHIDVLVNNAGLAAGISTVENGDPEDWDRMIDTNVKGLLNVSRMIIPGMKDRRSGHIINLGSIAGKQTYPNGNVYCATKHAVEALTAGMRIDLLPFKIRVTNVCPGAVETEFSLVRFHGDADKARSVYRGYTPLMAKDVAEVIYFAASRPPHVTLNDVLVMPTAQADATHFHRER